MTDKQNLTTGSILKKILKLALPIIAASFVQMAYNMTDMMWIGRLGGTSVAAVGTAGFFMWFGFSFILISKIGAEVGVSQAIGRKDKESIIQFARNAIQLNIFLSISYGIAIFLLAPRLISFFELGDATITNKGIDYLRLISFGLPFAFLNPVFSGIFNGSGDSKTPFIITGTGLVLNIVLDPILIFGFGFIPGLGVKGAAIATIASQFLVCMIFLIFYFKNKFPIPNFKIFKKPSIEYIKRTVKLGLPIGIRNGLFCFFSIILAKIISQWGPIPIAVQKVGAQIESLSWMSTEGFATAISAYMGQNFGAKKWERIWNGYFIGLFIVTLLGLATTYMFVFHSEFIFSIFIPEKKSILIGMVYLQILGISQLFMVYEIYTGGAFNGLGKTLFPAIISIIFTGSRIPLALYLSQSHILGLEGVWWSISMTSVVKGIILIIGFQILLYKHPKVNAKCYIKRLIRKWESRYLRDKRSFTGR